MWLALPATYNVLPALGFDTATFSDRETNQPVNLPFMRMPRMAGSLDTWASKPPSGAEVADRLIALAQSLNGLQYLYDHGFEGHGDLKPSNLLYDDLRSKFELGGGETWPSTAHPWRIRVADLGWADAWVDLGLSNKVLRTHMAPERFDAVVVPVKSDIFSMGIIAAELLQGQHPAENLKARTKSEGNWIKWVTEGTRNLSGVNSTKLEAVIRKCLSASPDSRPDALEFLNEICIELKKNFSLARDGGLHGAAGRVELKSGAPLRTKGFQVIPDGERLVLHLPGGGGMGDPAKRNPTLVAGDVRDGLVSVESAERDYRVALAPDGAVDEAATARLRRRS